MYIEERFVVAEWNEKDVVNETCVEGRCGVREIGATKKKEGSEVRGEIYGDGAAGRRRCNSLQNKV